MKKAIILIFAMILLVLIPFAEASALTDSVKDKIEFWWQGYNANGQVVEKIQGNNANYSGTVIPIARNYASFPSHNDSTEYFPTNEDNTLSSYSKFGIENIKDDLKGWWCGSLNVTPKSNLDKTIVAVSMGTGTGRHMTFMARQSPLNDFGFMSEASGLAVTFEFGTLAAGQKTFVCVGNTGEHFWAFQDGANKTLAFSNGADKGMWYGNVSGYLNGTFGAMTDFNNRLIFDESDMQVDILIYGNGTPTTEELVEMWNGTTLGSDPLNYSNVFGGGGGAADTTPPSITYYNLTSSDNGCESWNTNKNTACSTSSVTPTLQFNTNKNAWCAIAGSSSSTAFNINYTDIGSSRNCTGPASGEGGTSHLCTLTNQDELVYDTSYLFISCKDSSNNQNKTSTSGALKLSITGLEVAGRNSIGVGIQNALLSGYTNYTDLQIYARNLSNAQVKGTFDRAAKKGTKLWAFNRIGVSDSHVNMFNLTPVLYTLELANKTSSNITLEVEKLLNATK